MADSFYERAARAQWDSLEAEKQQQLADLARAKSIGDEDSGAAAIQHLANIESAKADLNRPASSRSIPPRRPRKKSPLGRWTR
jgi:hypothetical protein